MPRENTPLGLLGAYTTGKLTVAQDEDRAVELNITKDGSVADFECHCDMGLPNVHFHYKKPPPDFMCRLNEEDDIYLHIQYWSCMGRGASYFLKLDAHQHYGAFYFPEDWGMPSGTAAESEVTFPYRRTRRARAKFRTGSQDLCALQRHIQHLLDNIECSEMLLIRARGWNTYSPSKHGIAVFQEGGKVRGYGYPLYLPTRNSKRRYGCTREEAMGWLCSQGGICPICQERRYGEWCIDHVDTMSGPMVRGILCNGCNTELGKMGDTPDAIRELLQRYPKNLMLSRMLEYVESTEAYIKHRNGGKYPVKVIPVKQYRDKEGNITDERRQKRVWTRSA